MRIAVTRRSMRHATNTANELEKAYYGTDCFDNISDLAEAMRNHPYDLALMEARLDDGSTIEWLRRFGARKLPESTFVIVLSDREEERVAALEVGADDCAVLVVSGRELVAKIQAILRRPRARKMSSVNLGNLSMCTVTRAVTVAEQKLVMQRREVTILEALLRRAGTVVPRNALEHDLYGIYSDRAPNSLEVRISRLRRHLNNAGASPSIETVRGVGYRLVDDGVTALGI